MVETHREDWYRDAMNRANWSVGAKFGNFSEKEVKRRYFLWYSAEVFGARETSTKFWKVERRFLVEGCSNPLEEAEEEWRWETVLVWTKEGHK